MWMRLGFFLLLQHTFLGLLPYAMSIGHTEINEDTVLISALRSPLSNGEDKEYYKARRKPL